MCPIAAAAYARTKHSASSLGNQFFFRVAPVLLPAFAKTWCHGTVYGNIVRSFLLALATHTQTHATHNGEKEREERMKGQKGRRCLLVATAWLFRRCFLLQALGCVPPELGGSSRVVLFGCLRCLAFAALGLRTPVLLWKPARGRGRACVRLDCRARVSATDRTGDKGDSQGGLARAGAGKVGGGIVHVCARTCMCVVG